MMAGTRASARTYGKSDGIDAACVARAALREPRLPEACLSGPEHDVRLLTDHRDDLVKERARIQKRLRWHCHDLALALELPPRVLDRYVWLDRLEAALRAFPGSTRCRIALCELSRCRELMVAIRGFEREIRDLTKALIPELLAFPGCSAISAAHLVGETAEHPASLRNPRSRCMSGPHRCPCRPARASVTASTGLGTASSTRRST
jgi:hypothetical protein